MANAPMFQKATRSAVKLKIGLQGPSGAGKTLGALAMAANLAGRDRFAVIDTENGSASLYADRFDFDTLNLGAPYTSLAYVEAIKAAVAAGYKVLVIDSLSHQWAGKGGILSRKEDLDKRGGNSFTNWAEFTKEHEAFKAYLLNADVHIICTLRTKQEYVMEENAKGKQMPKKVGTTPVQREGMEYELSVVFELQMDHKAATSKDRTGLFDGKLLDLTDQDVARELREWLASAAPTPPAPSRSLAADTEDEQRTDPTRERSGSERSRSSTSARETSDSMPSRQDAPAGRTTTAIDPEGMTLEEAVTVVLPGPRESWGGKGGELLSAFSDKHLNSILKWLRERLQEKENADFAVAARAIVLILAERAKDQTALELDGAPSLDEEPEDAAAAPAPSVLEPTEKARAREAHPARTKRESVAARADDLPF